MWLYLAHVEVTLESNSTLCFRPPEHPYWSQVYHHLVNITYMHQSNDNLWASLSEFDPLTSSSIAQIHAWNTLIQIHYKMNIFDFSLVQASYGVLSTIFLVGHLFRIYTVFEAASPQNLFGISLSFIIVLIMFNIFIYLLLVIPLCWGVYGAMIACPKPSLLQNLANSIEVFSPPPSILCYLKLHSLYFSTCNLNFLKCVNNSPFLFIR